MMPTAATVGNRQDVLQDVFLMAAFHLQVVGGGEWPTSCVNMFNSPVLKQPSFGFLVEGSQGPFLFPLLKVAFAFRAGCFDVLYASNAFQASFPRHGLRPKGNM